MRYEDEKYDICPGPLTILYSGLSYLFIIIFVLFIYFGYIWLSIFSIILGITFTFMFIKRRSIERYNARNSVL